MYQAKIVTKGDNRFHATTRDAGFEMGVDSSNPVDVLLASLCACLGHYVADFLRQEKIRFSEYSICADSELVEDKSRLGDIHVVIDVKNATWNRKARAGLLDFITTCCIFGTLKANSDVRLKLV